MTSRDLFLKILLKCGIADLNILDGVQYDWEDIFDQLEDEPLQNVGMDGLIFAITDVGIIHLKEALEQQIEALRASQEKGMITKSDQERLNALESLDPDVDIKVEPNMHSTLIWFQQHKDIYTQFLAPEIAAFESNTNFCIMK